MPQNDAKGLETILGSLGMAAGANSIFRPGSPDDRLNHRVAVGPPLRDEELGCQAFGQRPAGPGTRTEDSEPPAVKFVPLAPDSLAKAQLAAAEIEAILLKFFLTCGAATGHDAAQQIALPFFIVEKVLQSLKADLMLVLKGSASMGDYVYELTDAGTHRARKHADRCAYFGAAPVPLKDYSAAVAAQSLQRLQIGREQLRRAFADLTLGEDMFQRVGRAILSGKGLFLHGPPGNGKTSIAERVTMAFGTSIWIPRAISAWGEIIRVFDPSCHEELPPVAGDSLMNAEKVDRRWVRIRRPTIVVGGELLMDNLEITVNRETGIMEAPVQMKSNCGVLVIDDFGRQQIPPAALLNRWIVPLEKRHDYLNLASGRKIQVPFDQFIIFSTNLEPRDLVDEAFLRRIPYKIDVRNPTEDEFRRVFRQVADAARVEFRTEGLDHLIDKYYKGTGRQMRFCHPRDLVHQVTVYYRFLQQPPRTSVEALDAAATDYFSVM